MKKKREMFWLAGIIVILSLIKLINLRTVPLFADEATYCYWGYQISEFGILNTWNEIVNQGKIAPVIPIIQTLGFWVFAKLSPILICRGTSVILSALTAMVLFFLAKQVNKNSRARWLVLLFYLLNPFEFFNSRTSLLEPGLNLMMILTVWLIYQKRYLQGVVWLMMTTLTKLTGFLIAPGLVLLSKGKQKFKMLIASGLVLGAVFYLTGLWSTFEYHSHSGFEIKAMLKRFWINLLLTKSWYTQYLHWGFWLAAILTVLQTLKQKQYIWLMFIVTILAPYILLADSYFPRFLLLTIPFWALLMGFLANRKVGLLVLGILIGIYLHQDYLIITKPHTALIAREDRFQFWEDWTSGIGIPNTIKYVDGNYKNAQVLIPQDLYHSFYLYNLDQKAAVEFIYDFDNESDLEGKLFIGTTHHNKYKSDLEKKYVLEEVFASNGQHANSMIVYEIN